MLCGFAPKAIRDSMDAYRLSLAAAAVGAAQQAVDYTFEYLATRPLVLENQGMPKGFGCVF